MSLLERVAAFFIADFGPLLYLAAGALILIVLYAIIFLIFYGLRWTALAVYRASR